MSSDTETMIETLTDIRSLLGDAVRLLDLIASRPAAPVPSQPVVIYPYPYQPAPPPPYWPPYISWSVTYQPPNVSGSGVDGMGGFPPAEGGAK
jgi:hypothetical protein